MSAFQNQYPICPKCGVAMQNKKLHEEYHQWIRDSLEAILEALKVHVEGRRHGD